jgi:hypothetical protein
MKTYDRNHIQELKSKTTQFHSLLNQAKEWVTTHVKHEEKATLLDSIFTQKSDTKSILESVETKPVFALFGQSQVGKSYLVKNLLSQDGKNLEIIFPKNQKFDFLQQINPTGNFTESTGVVTRFSLVDELVDAEYPVKVTLLDIKDVVLILCDSYFSDILSQPNSLDEEQIHQHIQKFQNIELKNNPTKELSDDDIYSIKKYFDTYLKRTKHNANVLCNSCFWVEAAKIIDRLDSNYWVQLFEILWGFDKNISNVFNRLLNTIEKLKFSKSIQVTTDAILRDKGKIIDVVRVSEMFIKQEPITIKTFSSEEITTDIHLLCALIAEIRMPLSNEIAEKKEFLKHTDLLDFPGARSREPYEVIKEGVIQNMFLRGKISYLFNKYSSNYEINNLLFCVKNQQNEVKEIPLLINDWIKFNVGNTSEERQRRIGSNGSNPLFIILTFYNSTLEFNPNNDTADLSHKWENRFIKIFKKEIVFTNNWDDEWTTEHPKFKNIYLLRDFTFSDHLFSGYLENNSELEVKNKEYYNRLKSSFINYPYVIEHFENPEDAWNSATTPNNDGTERILNDLTPSANNLIKIRNYTQNLSEYKVQSVKQLKKYHFADDVQEQRIKAVENGTIIREQLLNLFTKKSHSYFGEFLEKLYVSHTHVYNFIHENYLPAKNDHAPSKEEVFLRTYGLNLALSVEENKVLLMSKLGLSSLEEVTDWLVNKDIDMELALENVHVSAANKLVDGVIDLWKKSLNTDNFIEFERHGLDLGIVRLIAESLLETFEIFQIRKILIQIFERKTRLMTVSNDTDEYLASISSSYINDFVSNFGFNFMSDERKINVMTLAEQYQLDTSSLIQDSSPINEIEIINLFEEDSSENDLMITYPVVNHYNSFITKIQLILLSNCGFRSFDVVANDHLNHIIQEIETVEF